MGALINELNLLLSIFFAQADQCLWCFLLLSYKVVLDQLDYSLTTGFFQSVLWKSHNIVQFNTLASHFSVDSDKT